MRVRYDHLPATALAVFIAIFERPWWQLVAGLGVDGGRATFCGHRHDATTEIRGFIARLQLSAALFWCCKTGWSV